LREELADTVKRSDFEELKAVVRKLAEAQKRTEEEIIKLTKGQAKIREELGGLSC